MHQAAHAEKKTRRPARHRRTKTRERALAAASRILRHEGYARLTMERVVAESGVAKTTLYRRWPTKAALCVDLYLDVAGRQLRDPDTGNVASDLEHIANTVIRLQSKTVAGPAFLGLLAEALVHSGAPPAFLTEFSDRRREVTRQVLRRAIKRGELRRDTDVDLVIDALGGAVTFRLLQGHAPLTRKFVYAAVGLVLSGCRAASEKPVSARKEPR